MAKATRPRMGRASIFRGKMRGGKRVQTILTAHGCARFEAARKDLGRLYKEVTGRVAMVVSDSDVVEYLARGRDDTERYLEAEELKRPAK